MSMRSGLPRRDEVLSALQEAGIGVGIHYPVPVHLQKAYANLGYRAGDFPVTERLAERVPLASDLSGTAPGAGGRGRGKLERSSSSRPLKASRKAAFHELLAARLTIGEYLG